MESCPSRPWGMVDGVVAPVEGCRALSRSWWSDLGHCSVSCNSGEMTAVVTVVNSSHTSFYREAVLHSKRGKAPQYQEWLE